MKYFHNWANEVYIVMTNNSVINYINENTRKKIQQVANIQLVSHMNYEGNNKKT